MSIKTLRFEPYPANAEEAKKKRAEWTGAIDIPEDTEVRVEALPGRHVIFAGKVTDAFSKNFQPGKYVYSMEKFISAREDNVPGRSICTGGEFLIDCTEEQWQALWGSKPKMVKCLQTTEGPRLLCQAPGCNKKSESRLAAFLHEARVHFGIDPLKEPHKAVEVELQAGRMSKQISAAKIAAQQATP